MIEVYLPSNLFRNWLTYPVEGGGVGTWVNVCWGYAAGLSGPLSHYSLFFWPNRDHILINHFLENVIFATPT